MTSSIANIACLMVLWGSSTLSSFQSRAISGARTVTQAMNSGEAKRRGSEGLSGELVCRTALLRRNLSAMKHDERRNACGISSGNDRDRGSAPNRLPNFWSRAIAFRRIRCLLAVGHLGSSQDVIVGEWHIREGLDLILTDEVGVGVAGLEALRKKSTGCASWC